MRLMATVLASDTTRRFVITGTSGSGKTTLLEGLRTVGYLVYEEAARKVLLRGSTEAKSDADIFVQEMLSMAVADFLDARRESVAFFDRGIPDTLAYAIRFKVPTEKFKQASERHRYESKVFVLPPWEDIFHNDEVRRATFDVYVNFHKLLLDTYSALGYSIIDVPKYSVPERVCFIKQSVEGGA
jgi:predicted ATPase